MNVQPSSPTQASPKKLACSACGYEWLPRIETRQRKCPNCQSRKWDQNKTYEPPPPIYHGDIDGDFDY